MLDKVKLDQLCTPKSSNLAQKDILDNHGKYPVYGASGFIKNVDFFHQNTEYIAVVKDGAGIGRTMFLPPKSSIIGTMQYLIPKNNVVPKYLYYAVKGMNLSRYYSGSTIPHIYFKDYKKELVPLYSNNKQEMISSSLEKLEEIVEKKQQQLSEYDKLIKSRFVEMFGDPIKNDKNWITNKLNDICPINKYKGSVENKNGQVWLLNLDMIESNTGSIVGYIFVEERKIPNSTIKFDSNCVLYSKLRPYLNKVVVPSQSGYATSEIISMRTDKVNKYFLSKLLMMKSFVDFANKTAYGAKMPRASVDTIKNFDLIVPPIALQNQFASFVKQVDKLKFEVQKSLEEVQMLFDSLLQEYFG